MRVIGLTGGMGSGKSTVAALLARAGAVVVDADQAARDVVEPGQPALADIAERFGLGVLDDDGRLDRPGLARLVFADAQALADLEAITHPRIAERIAEQFAAVAEAEAADGRERTVVLDHPLLVETGQAHDHEVVVVVAAPVEVRVARLAGQRGIAEEDARARIASQATDEERRAAATHVIDNGGDLASLQGQVARLVEQLGIVPAGDHPTPRPAPLPVDAHGPPRPPRPRTTLPLRLLGVLAAALLLLALIVATTRDRQEPELEGASAPASPPEASRAVGIVPPSGMARA